MLTSVRLRNRYVSLSFETSPFFISQRVDRMVWNIIVIVGRSLGESKHIVSRSLTGDGHSGDMSGRPSSFTVKE